MELCIIVLPEDTKEPHFELIVGNKAVPAKLEFRQTITVDGEDRTLISDVEIIDDHY